MYYFTLRVFTTIVLGVLKNAVCAVVFCDVVDWLFNHEFNFSDETITFTLEQSYFGEPLFNHEFDFSDEIITFSLE